MSYSVRPGPRLQGFSAAASNPLATYTSDANLKAHPDYRAAKGGDAAAAVRLVSDLVVQEQLDEAASRFGKEVIYAPVIAEEQGGRNTIPSALAAFYAEATGARDTPALLQVNRAFHTGAGPMERLIVRPRFAAW